LFLTAYAKLYANAGALTAGADPHDTVDAMSLQRIDAIIAALDAGNYQWKPSRRVYVPKPNGKLRPISVASWSDKLVQEVLRMVLSAYYEPQFSDHSHGFRPGRGCHTALQHIRTVWKGTKWFIEGDIRACFDELDRKRLMEILTRRIKDERLMKLLRGMLEAGYLDDWDYRTTCSGVPQGGVLSPLLANIFLNELDAYVEEHLIPEYTRGKARRLNPTYGQVRSAQLAAKQAGDFQLHRELRRQQQRLPSKDTYDEGYRRLRYVRYADDTLFGFTGPRREAEEIKRKVGAFLKTLGLTLSEEKTLITHATEGRARFLGYDISMAHGDTKQWHGRRSINGWPILRVPNEVARAWQYRYTRRGWPCHRRALLDRSDYDIVMTYAVEFQGLVNYYALAVDVAKKLYPVKWYFMESLAKTLAFKHKQKATWAYRRYKRKTANGLTAMVVEVSRQDKPPLVAKFGAQPIRFDPRAVISDQKTTLWLGRSELVQRLLADHCELCGSTHHIEVHHLHKLKDIAERYRGRPDPPDWVVRHLQLRRKTLVVCADCHRRIHAGAYDGRKLKQDPLESRVTR
jgi:group II intron reverse transcriptase/maturase